MIPFSLNLELVPSKTVFFLLALILGLRPQDKKKGVLKCRLGGGGVPGDVKSST